MSSSKICPPGSVVKYSVFVRCFVLKLLRIIYVQHKSRQLSQTRTEVLRVEVLARGRCIRYLMVKF